MALPEPQPGLVISYAYLWNHEHRVGQEEGRKDRPSVIVLTTRRESDDGTIVTVLPITHSAPESADLAVEIPPAVKRHLGLDADRSWIVVARGNAFLSPRYDLPQTTNAHPPDYSVLPP